MYLYEQDSITYAVDDNGIVYFIVDRKVKRRIIAEDDWKYNRWEQYNLNQAYKGGEPIECYEEFLVDVLDCVLTIEEAIILEEYKKQQGHAKYMKSKTELDTFIRDNLGGFYFSIYPKLLNLKVEPQYITRFMDLCTYMNYDNKLVMGKTKGVESILEKDLSDILMLKDEETRKTKNAFIKYGLITIEEDKTITINKKIAVKGKIGKRDLKGSIRVMENGIREIYAKATPKEHKKLSTLFKVLPYVNYHHNILCKNPWEEDINKVEPLTIKEICVMMGYNINQCSRFKKDLLSIKVSGMDAILFVLRDNKFHIYINPLIYYKGNNIDNLKSLINMFKVGNGINK